MGRRRESGGKTAKIMNGEASRYKTERAARRRKRIVYRGEALQGIETELEGGGTVASSRPRLLYYRGVRWLRYESISGVKRDSVMGVREASKVTAIILFARPSNAEISFLFSPFFALL